MTEIFKGKWAELKPDDYINEVRRAADVVSLMRTKIIDLGNYHTDLIGKGIQTDIASNVDIESLIAFWGLETEQYTVTLPDEWKEFSDSCNTVRFKCKKRWQDTDAQNYSLNEWIGSEDYLTDEKVRPLETKDEKLSEDIIVTAFDPIKCRRVIISGLHRSAAVTVRTRECDPKIPPVRIYECRGNNIDRLFPCDFLHL